MRLSTVLSIAILTCTLFSIPANAQVNSTQFIQQVLSKKVNDNFSIPLSENRQELAIVEQFIKDETPGTTVVLGRFFGRQLSSFRIEIKAGSVNGLAFFHNERLAYKLSNTGTSTELITTQVSLDEVMCLDHTRPLGDSKGNSGNTTKSGPEIQMVPLLESLPGANCVLYLDFDGETVTGTSWNSTYNSGNPIVAATSGLSNANVTEVWQRTAEDFLPFNINVTTDSNKYNAAPQGRRMKCIITPTDTWYPSSVGGVAYLNSFLWTGRTPCWVFITSNNKYIAEAVSHELGHTLSLSHDGQIPTPTYYLGHGTGNVGWAPIMGAGYYEYVSQWSIGEYTNANNQQDDVALIASTSNTFGYRPDDHSNTPTGATPLVIVGNSVSASSNRGIIERRTDIDVFSFTKTSTFNMNLNFAPGLPGPNLDILAELYDANSTLVLANNFTTDLYANLVMNNIPPGTYTIRVSGVGYLVPATGYSDYGSIGYFGISGTITTVTGAVAITPLTAITFCGTGSATLQASPGFTSYTWAPAASLSASTGQTVIATPTVTTTYTVTGVPPSGPNTQAIITVTINPLPTIVCSPSAPSFCAGDSVLVTASGSATYSWAPTSGLSNPTSASTYAQPTITTTYTVTGTNGNGCTNTTLVTVTLNSLPTLNISNSLPVFCAGDSSQLNVTGSGVSFLWTPSTNLSCSTCANPLATPTTTTTYSLVVTGANGCTNAGTANITVNPLPIVQFNNLGTACVDWIPFTLTTATPPGGTYSGTGVSAGVFDPMAAGAGTHVLTYSFTDVNGCSATDTTSIVVSLCTGIYENESAITLNLYPVPATDQLTLSFTGSGNYSIQIVNVLGQCLKVESLNVNSSTTTISLPASMAKGLYTLVLLNEAGANVAAKPFVKE